MHAHAGTPPGTQTNWRGCIIALARITRMYRVTRQFLCLPPAEPFVRRSAKENFTSSVVLKFQQYRIYYLLQTVYEIYK